MGMFDYFGISTELLPVNEETKQQLKECDFQTKSLDCLLERYEVLPDKTLVKLVSNVEGEQFKPLIYSGNINFYDYILHDDGTDTWYEFDATFIDGFMTKIETTPEPEF